MRHNRRIWQLTVFLGLLFFFSGTAKAEGGTGEGASDKHKMDTASVLFPKNLPDMPAAFSQGVDQFRFPLKMIHRIGIEGRPSYNIPTNPFFEGENQYWKPLRNSSSVHLKYSFQAQPHTYLDRVYHGAYQGVGIAAYRFGDYDEVGQPLAVYLFQGARIARLCRRLSLNYEWNFGVSWGWKPYDYNTNGYNKVIGSKANAYLNTNFYFNWMFSPHLDLNLGVSLSHFSNGNTQFPNAGINTMGVKLGVVYNMNRKENFLAGSAYQMPIPVFPRHISYDLVLFGSWRRKGVVSGENDMVASPEAYGVAGFTFAPMYNLGYKFRVGASLDGVYDGSANVYTEDYIVGTEQEFFKPALRKQLALGVSARAEYVMPYFSIGIGLGTNVLHAGGDLKSFYQVLSLKIEVTRSSFLHIGYNLKDFHDPNYLMLGIGFRFHNKYPTLHR